jgi:SAM-dependent methyltransferase
LRRLIQDPARILAPYVGDGMTVIEPGPGMGFFTLELARKVGPSGRVVAVDIQPRMLGALKHRAAKAGLLDRIETRLALPTGLGVAEWNGTADFVLAFAVVHELPSPGSFFAEASDALKPGGTILLAEPTGHVSTSTFDLELDAAKAAGLAVTARPQIRRSRAALLTKTYRQTS